MAMAVGVLFSGCVELPEKAFFCAQDGDCERIPSQGAPYVCRESMCVLPEPVDGSDAGPDAGPDGGPDTGPDGGTDGGPDAGPTDCTQAPAAMPCFEGGWCWDNPLSAGARLFAIRGRSESDIWAVGQGGVALHWDGACWSRSQTGSSYDLRGIWPAEGSTWRVVGANGTLLEWNGSSWTPGNLGTTLLRDLEGGPGNTAFAVGDKGTVQFFNGTQWSAQDAGTTSHFHSVWPVSSSEAWAFAEGGFIFHGVDGRWASPVSLTRPVTYESAVGLSDGGILAVGTGSIARWSSTGWTQADFAQSTTPLNGVWHDSGRTWIVGAPWSIFQPDFSPDGGPAQPDAGTESSGTPHELRSVWSLGEKGWAVGEAGAIVQRGDSRWAEVPGGVARNVRDLWQTNDGLWAVGDDSLIMRRVNGAWRPVAPPDNNSFLAVWGSGDLLLVLGGGGKVYAYQNGKWTSENPGGGLNALWGAGPGAVWAVGDDGAIRRRNSNGTWVSEQGPSGISLNAIWGSSATDVWAVGASGGIYHRDCDMDTCTWTRQVLLPETTLQFFGVWGSQPDDVWAVGNSGVIYHYNGTDWRPQLTPSGTPALRAIAGRDGSHLWAVGSGGIILFGDGIEWTQQAVGKTLQLEAIWVTQDTVWVGGLFGTIIKQQ